MSDIYYEDQTNWTRDDYYTLFRYISRLFNYASRRQEEISCIDVSRVSEVTRALLKATIEFQGKQEILDFPNLRQLAEVQPLPFRINLVDFPTGAHEAYEKYNIGL